MLLLFCSANGRTFKEGTRHEPIVPLPAFLRRNASRGQLRLPGSRLFLSEAELPFPVEVGQGHGFVRRWRSNIKMNDSFFYKI